MEAGNQTYPVQFDVDYPDRDLNRLTTAFRILWVIPIAIVLGSVSIVAVSRWLLGLSAVLAVCGVLLTVNGFLLLVPFGHG